MMNTLNENIKKLRIARNYNQVEFAKQLGVTKQCVCNWENDNVVPSIDMLVKMADLFKVSTDFLLGRSDKKMLDISNLSDQQAGHISAIVDYFINLNKEKCNQKS